VEVAAEGDEVRFDGLRCRMQRGDAGCRLRH
jgi:hypothetical protein